jgi:hypothetical protein
MASPRPTPCAPRSQVMSPWRGSDPGGPCKPRHRREPAPGEPAATATVRTLSDIENGVRKASPGTYAILENKLSWAPGSIDTILAGGEPKDLVVELRRTTPDRLSRTATDTLSRASTEELLLELRRRIVRPRERRHDTWDDWGGGLDPHDDWPEEG